MKLKLKKIGFFILSVLTFLTIFIKCSQNIENVIFNQMRNKVSGPELFKIYSLVYKKNKDLSSEESKTRLKTFELNLQKSLEEASSDVVFNSNFDLNSNRELTAFSPINWASCVTPSPVTKNGSTSYSGSNAVATAIESAVCIKTEV